MNIQIADELIEAYKVIPKNINQPTYLELCKYPQRRFEEICSRILCFYFDPKEQHGLGDLFIRSLFSIIDTDKNYQLHRTKITIVSEENAEGKRLDIVIYSDNFVIGIENKITAALYNPLEIYKNRIENYSKKHASCIILSLHKLTNEADLKYMNENNFKNITYSDLFENIKNDPILLSKSSLNKYIFILNDFIETIENMKNNHSINEDLSIYFFNNKDEVEKLINSYNEYNRLIRERQIEKIYELKVAISNITDRNWLIFEGWDLYYQVKNTEGFILGIESYFESTVGSPFGKYIILITTWDIESWNRFHERIKEKYPGLTEKVDSNRRKIIVEIIDNPKDDDILNRLKKHLNCLFEITT